MDTTFSGLSSSLEGRFQSELQSLSGEANSEIYYDGLLYLGQRLEAENRLEVAGRIYSAIVSPPVSSPVARAFRPASVHEAGVGVVQNRGPEGPCYEEIRRRAQARLDAMTGTGSSANRAEFLLRRLARETMEPSSLVGLTAASAAFRVTRLASLSRLLGSPTANFATRGFGARAAAGLLAFGVEATVFPMASRGAAAALGRDLDWSFNQVSREIAGSFLVLGAMKLVGWGLPHLGHDRLLRGGAGPTLQQAGMFAGILLGHQLETAAGLRPHVDGATTFVDSLAMLVQLNAAGRLSHGIMGEGFRAWELGLDHQARTLTLPPLPVPPPQGGRGLANEFLLSAESLAFPSPLVGEGPRRGGEGARANPLFQAPILAMSSLESVEGKIETFKGEPLIYTPAERKSLIEMTHKASPGRAWQIMFAARDFARLSDISRSFKEMTYERSPIEIDTFEDVLISLLRLEDYESALRMAGDPSLVEEFEKYYGDVIDIENTARQSVPLRQTPVVDYAVRRGFQKTYYFRALETIQNLISLSQNYDVFIGIARGGLFSASLADIFGFPNWVMEIHAHGRKRATSRWVDPVNLEQIKGRRVLLLDKDAVTGATIEEAVKLLRPLEPSAIGAYLNQSPRKRDHVPIEPRHGFDPSVGRIMTQRLVAVRTLGKVLPPQTVRRIEGLGVRIHHPMNVPALPLESTFYEAHERLQTILGRDRRLTRFFDESVLSRAREVNPSLADEMRSRFQAILERGRNLNPFVPGVERIRDSILRSLEVTLAQHQDLVASGFRDPYRKESYERLSQLLMPPSEAVLAEDLARDRYYRWGVRLAKTKGITLEHIPSDYASAFRTATLALKAGGYEAALIVGPEGFAYEPIFRDLGVPTVAVNIPEADFGGRRTLKVLDDLIVLRGKRVLVVEDDVRSGATLVRLLRTLRRHGPFAELGLFLGLPRANQRQENIPAGFQKIFISNPSPADSQGFLDHLSEREAIFKKQGP